MAMCARRIESTTPIATASGWGILPNINHNIAWEMVVMLAAKLKESRVSLAEGLDSEMQMQSARGAQVKELCSQSL